MNEALQKLEQPNISAPAADEFNVMRETATMLVKTGFLPSSINTPEKAMAIILTGRELGIGTMAALNTINVISGKPTVSPQLMLALIERSGQLEDIQITNIDSAVKCTMKRRGRSPHTEFFGEAEAVAMQLHGKDNYKKQAFTMYRWRAVAACARVVFPDVISGLYTPDEMGANVDEDGELLPPPKDNIRPIQTIDAVPVEKKTISTLCDQLNAAGDSIQWSKQPMLEYCQQLFNDDALTDLTTLTDEQREFLAEDLQERLDVLQKA